MKKIYSFMLALFATLCVGVAYAEDPVTITINVDNPNAIEVTMTEGWDEIVLSLKAGDNEVKIPYNAEYGEYEILKAKAKSGYLVNSLTVSPADAPEWNDYSEWGWGYEFHPTAECDGAVYSFHTSNLNDYRKDSVIFIIDNPSNVQVMYYGSGSINIKEDTSVVYYCGDETVEALQDLPLTVQPTYGKMIYKVFHNDTELKKIESWDGAYYAVETPESGDTVRVLTKAPEGTVAPAILELDSVALEALDSVMVNGAKVDLKDTLIVPWGEKIELAFNIEDYKVTVNNTPLSNYSNPYTAVVTDTTEIVATAEAYEKYNVTLILHDYTCFEQLYVDDYIFPKQDTIILTMSSKSTRVTLYAATDCIIDSIKWQDVVQKNISIECAEEGVLEAWAHKIVRNQKFMLYVQRDSMNYSSVSTKQRHYFCDYYNPLQADYTECLFSEADDNPINVSISTLSYDKAVCYLNDSILTPGMWGSVEVNLADGDVLKAFADTAEVYTVEFVLNGEATTSNVTKDRIVAVEASKFTVLQGTEVSFKTAETTILVNGEAVEAVDSVVTVTINANTTIEVGVKPSIANTAENPYTVTEAIELTKAGVALKDSVYVIGIVDSLQYVAKYKDVNVWVHDSLNRMEFFAMYGFNRDSINSEEDLAALVAVGDTLIAKGTLTYYAKGDIYELNMGCYAIEVRKAAVEPELVVDHAQLVGSWVDPWDGPNFVVSADSTCAIATKELAEGKYWFGLKLLTADNQEVAWMTNQGATITRDAVSSVFAPQNGDAAVLEADVAGEYVFTLTGAEEFTLTITFPAKPEGIFNATVEGQAEKFVRDGQLIIRMNGVEYNVLGAKIQ